MTETKAEIDRKWAAYAALNLSTPERPVTTEQVLAWNKERASKEEK